MSADTHGPLYSLTPVVSASERTAPVIVVGLPRSGSTFLAHVLSQIDNWYIFDDLFLLRQAKSVGASGDLNDEQLKNLVGFLGWQLRARIRWASFSRPQCKWEEVDEFEEALLTTFRDKPVTWDGLLEEWLTRLARHHGCKRWGYKAPQDFMNADELLTCFPGLQFVFLVRDPRNVMASKKFVAGEDGKPAEYHPLVYAYYWRMSVKAAQSIRKRIGERILIVKFEELIADPNAEAKRLAKFLGATFRGDVQRTEGNTSFKGTKREGLTKLEEWICEKIAGDPMRHLGYEMRHSWPRPWDVFDLAWTSLRFLVAQLRRLITNGAARQSILMFIRSLFRRK